MNERKLRFPFRISVTLAFILISVPLLVAVIGILYQRNAQLARQLAIESMERASAEIASHIDGLLNPLARVVEATAALGKIDRGALRRPEAFQYYLKVLDSAPQAESLYVGFERDGAFYQAAKLAPDLQRFGPRGLTPPKQARYAMRILDASSGEMADSYLYLAGWGDIVSVERVPASFDPRQRPWYVAAWSRPGLSISDAYVFFSSGRPGLTLSQRIATDDGLAIGTAGADISLTALSDFMARQRIGRHGVAVIIDNNGRLIGHPDLHKILHQDGNDITLTKVSDVDDPLVAQAIGMREAGAGDRFSANLAGETHLVSFTPFPDRFGKDWSIGVIAAEGDFVGPIRQASLFMLALGAAVTLLSILAILRVSGSLTSPLGRIVEETKRIRDFNLGTGLRIDSRIAEIHELGHALEAMKEGLRSFGAYIPKALVRTIVASGKGTGIGGERRTLTILFTDIADFTRRSEALPPEEVLDQLSAYFDILSRCIHEAGGTVDKFIGDAVMAFWNAPVADPDHVANACRAVLRCRATNAALNEDLAVRGHSPLPTRFGIHTGDVVVGNVGSTDRMQYTALGAEVNLASRVEGLNKVYGTQIIVTGTVEHAARELFLFRPLDLVVPAGTSQAVALFELVGARAGPDRAPDAAFAQCREWREALDLYRSRDWGGAITALRAFAEQYSQDRTARLYIDRCARFLGAPPPADWDGAEHYDVK